MYNIRRVSKNKLLVYTIFIMPYTIKKLPSGKYKVTNKTTKKVIAKGTTKTKAQNQVKLINMLKKRKKKNK